MVLYTESLKQYIASERGGKSLYVHGLHREFLKNDRQLSGLKELISFPTSLVNEDGLEPMDMIFKSRLFM